MVRCADAKPPAPAGRDLGVTVLVEKGNLEGFPPYLDEKAKPLEGG